MNESDDFVEDDFEQEKASHDDFKEDDFEEEKPEIDPKLLKKFMESPAATFPTGKSKENFVQGALSELTFGHSEKIPGLEPQEGEEGSANFGKLIGSLPLFETLSKVFAGPALKLASKSPIFQKQLASLATMFGVGFTEKGIEKVAHGEMPSLDEMLEHGADWAKLDGLLQLGGATGKFAYQLSKSLLGKAFGKTEAVNRVYQKLIDSGVDMTNPDRVSAKALEILNEPLTDAEIQAAEKLKLPKKELSKETELAKDIIGKEEITSKDLKTRKITDEPVNRLTKESVSLAEPYQPKGDFTQESDKLAQDALYTQLELSAPRAASEEVLGNSIREDINKELESLKKEYRPLYEYAETRAEDLTHYPDKTAEVAKNKLNKLSKGATKPEGYAPTIKKLEDVLKDLGYVIEKDNAGKIVQVIRDSNVRVSESIELARRLNEIVDFEAIEPQVKDALKGVVKQLKQDIREGLKADPQALAAFEMAEKEHARVAGLYGKDSILNIRGQQAGEKISKLAESPSVLGDLKKTLSSQQMAQVEREILEKLNTQNYEKGKKTLREIDQHLSEKNKKLAREIVESKNSHNPEALRKLEKSGILDDMSKSITNGSRPDKTLKLWKTRKGQKLVKEAFHNSPNWPQVKSYLEKQSFNDMVSSVLKDGKIDLKKFKTFMEDPAVMFNIREQGGEEALHFFRELNGRVNQLEKNVKLLDHLPSKSEINRGKELLKRTKEKNKFPNKEKSVAERTLADKRAREKETSLEKGNKILERMSRKDYPIQKKIDDWKEWFKDTMGLNSQAAMTVFGLAKLTGPGIGAYAFGVPNTIAALVGYKMMNYMLTNPKVRKAFVNATKHQVNSFEFILALNKLNESIEEAESEED